MEKLIPIKILPPIIRDAFLVAQKMDVPYIWIYALYIIQDDEENWENEFRRMDVIYANTYFTITETAAENSSQRFLWPRTPP